MCLLFFEMIVIDVALILVKHRIGVESKNVT